MLTPRRIRAKSCEVISIVASRLVTRRMTMLGRSSEAGIRIVDASAGHPAVAATHQATADAIDTLRALSAVHVRWMRRFVNQVVLVAPMGTPAAYESLTRSVFVGCDVGLQHDSAAVAAFLAHEIAHARVAATGLRLNSRHLALRRRVEQRCVREQLEALLRINPTHYLVPWFRVLLQPGAELTPSPVQVRANVQRTYRRIRSGGYPRWTGRLAVCLAVGFRRG